MSSISMSSINTISSICQVCPSMSKYVKYVKYVINVRWIMMKISHRSMNKKVEVKRLHSKNTYNSLLIFLFGGVTRLTRIILKLKYSIPHMIESYFL